MSNCLVRVEGVSRYFGDMCVVNNVSFEIKRGEVLGFLGANGAGKSTMMRMLSGNLALGAGRIWIDGYDLLDQPLEAKGALGYLPDQPPLYRDLTVDEYLQYSAKLNKIPRQKISSAIARARMRCGLDGVGRRIIANLSKGYQQRVGIAQAIIHNPAIVILDEPTVGLDPIQIREIRILITELAKDHGVILSTHILPEVQAVCSHVQIIHRGSLVLNDSLEGLERRMQATSIVLGLHHAPELSVLAAVEGVLDVETIDIDRYRLRVDDGEAVAERFAALSAQHQWRLFELTHERMTLEQLFIDITCADHALEETV